MSDLQKKMIRQATRKHKKIYPCANKQALKECFTNHEDLVLFWYNTEDHSTHVMTAPIKGKTPNHN